MLGGQAWAAPVPPSLDTVAMCEAQNATRTLDAQVEECISSERRALDYLRTAYPAVPAVVRSRCERLSRKSTRGFGSYAFIQGCVDLK